jgi:NADH-quinone oxidoreductase subunit C
MADTVDTSLEDLADLILSRKGDDILSAEVVRGELVVVVGAQTVATFAQWLKSDPNCRFTTLIDITAVDYPEREQRFEMVYHFLSMPLNQRIRVKAGVREGEFVPSITASHPVADWFERETFDLYGVMFSGHPDLRRILTDYGFRGHPLRKDFPTTGYVELRYDETLKRVVYEPVKLPQEYRQFDFLSPWEGAGYMIPGDEKATK